MQYGTGAALVVLASVMWSFTGLAIRNIHEAGTWAVLFWRSVGLVPVLMAFVIWRSGGHPLDSFRKVGWPGVFGGIGLAFAFAGAIFALQNTTVANAVFLFAASPMLAAVLGWILLGERVRAATWASIAVAGIGMFVMVREGLVTGAVIGNVAAILSALGFAAFTVALRWSQADDTTPSIVIAGLFSMLIAIVMLPVQGETLDVPLPDILIAVALGACLLGTGLILYTIGARVVPAAELTLLSMVEVMLAPVWVWLFVGETATANTLAGGAILLLAIAGNALSGARRPASPPIT